jgi:hypothetical protein
VIDPFVAVLMVFAVARVTRLIAADDITAPLRARATGWRKTLVNCAWCVSIWVSVIVVATGMLYGHTWWWQCGALALLASHITGLLSRLETSANKTVRVETMFISPLAHQKLPDVDYGAPDALDT